MRPLTTQSNDHGSPQRSEINHRSHCTIRFAVKRHLVPPISSTHSPVIKIAMSRLSLEDLTSEIRLLPATEVKLCPKFEEPQENGCTSCIKDADPIAGQKPQISRPILDWPTGPGNVAEPSALEVVLLVLDIVFTILPFIFFGRYISC